MTPESVPRSVRRVLMVAIAGIAVFATISVYGNVSDIGTRMSGFAWWTFAVGLGLAVLSFTLRFLRWNLYLKIHGYQVPLRSSLQIFLSGLALSITPGKVGELIKSYLLRTAHGIPIAATAPIVVAERVTDLVAFLLLGLTGVILYDVGRPMVVAGLVIVGCGIGVLVNRRLTGWFLDLLTSPRRLSKWRPTLRELHGRVAEMVRPWPFCWATTIAVTAWLAEATVFALIVSGFPGTNVPFGLAVLIYSTTTLAGALSFLPGGLLVTEAGMTVLLLSSSRGVDQASAAAATILTRLATLWLAVALGLIALALFRRRLGKRQPSLDDVTS